MERFSFNSLSLSLSSSLSLSLASSLSLYPLSLSQYGECYRLTFLVFFTYHFYHLFLFISLSHNTHTQVYRNLCKIFFFHIQTHIINSWVYHIPWQYLGSRLHPLIRVTVCTQTYWDSDSPSMLQGQPIESAVCK